MESANAAESKDPYTWDGLTGWKSYRMLRPFRGMYWDVRRRFPYYWSDIKDGFNYRTFAATVRMYFVKSATPHPYYFANTTANNSQPPPCASLHPRHEPANRRLLRHQRSALLVRTSSTRLQHAVLPALDHRRHHRSDLAVQLHHLRHSSEAAHLGPVPAVHSVGFHLGCHHALDRFDWESMRLHAVYYGFF